jgi:hypothetical protein
MPLSINVGLSRKASKDFQSSGVSINVTAELDQALLARPRELQHQIGQLYAQAEEALGQQAARLAEPDRRASRRHDDPPHPDHGRSPPDRDQSRSLNGAGRMTESQRRAIYAIARRVGVDPAYKGRQIMGAELDGLTVRQASNLIDHLNGLIPASDNPNGH